MPLFLTVAVIVYAVLCRLYLLCEWTELAIIVVPSSRWIKRRARPTGWGGTRNRA